MQQEARQSSAPEGSQEEDALLFRQIDGICGLTAYKVLGNSMTMQELAADAFHLDDLDGEDSLQHPEWHAVYMQFLPDHVLGTVPYRWESARVHYDAAQLNEVTFTGPVDVVVLEGGLLHNHSVSGADKATAIKRKLGESLFGSDGAGRLMEELGRRGKMALVCESEDEWELLVPHNLLRRLQIQERPVARWRRHPTLPVSDKWQDAAWGDHERWEPWTEGLVPACVRELKLDILRASRRAARHPDRLRAGSL